MSVKTLTRVAIMVALAVVLKSFFSPMVGAGVRINTYGTPIVVVGMMFGPIIGGITGYIVDVIYSMSHGYPLIPNPFTISTVMWGVIPGLLFYKVRLIRLPRLIVVVVLASFSELFFNTWGSLVLFGSESTFGLLPWRILVFLLMIPVHTYIIDVVYSRVVKPELSLLLEE